MARSGKNRQGAVYWVLTGLSLALLSWVWWESRGQSRPPANSKEASTNPVVALPPAQSIGSKHVAETNAMAPTPVLSLTNNPPVVIEKAMTSPPPETVTARGFRSILELQLALVRNGISPGSLDGVMGSQTRSAIRAFQQRERLPLTGEFDVATRSRLIWEGPAERTYAVTSNDFSRLTTIGTTWLTKSLQERLDHETILELLAEEGWAHPNLVRRLNPSVNWTNVMPGTAISLPDARYPPLRNRAAVIRIRLADRVLQAFDSDNALLVHFPCSIAKKVEKRPIGQMFVERIALNPNYRFDPDIFPESAEARQLTRPLMLPPGPNNPVGTAWIGLNRPGYGIHGTPRPEEVGRTESHGCFRLANWNAQYLAQLVRVGTSVIVEP